MKTILLSTLLILLSLFSNSQTYYKATVSEMYTYNKLSDSWDLYQKNSDVNITVVVEKEHISFHAKSPTMYKLYSETRVPLDVKPYKGYRYNAKDLKNDNMVKVDIMASESSSLVMISIINYDTGYNFRYFLTIKE